MKFIEIDLKTGDGGFLIPESEDGQELADELLKNPNYIHGVKHE